MLNPLADPGLAAALAAKGVTAISLDGLPRTLSRTQPMDALSSQANVAGYKAALVAAATFGRFFPHADHRGRHRAAGQGAGARHRAWPACRPSAPPGGSAPWSPPTTCGPQTKTEVESLGATFIELTSVGSAAGEGGYARALTDDERQAQQAELAGHIARHDVVITTAQVPGRRPPRAGHRGRDEGDGGGLGRGGHGGRPARRQRGRARCRTRRSSPGTGSPSSAPGNLAASMPAAASAAYARNVSPLLLHLVEDGALAIDPTDEIQAGVVITHDGDRDPARHRRPARRPARRRRCRPVTTALLTDITIFVLALLVGFEVISKVPATLHTPLMSAANSIHGIVLAGAMLIAATANNALGYVLAFIAAAFAAMNVVGGYVVTGRMLKMFRRGPGAGGGHAADGQPDGQARPRAAERLGS